MKKKSMKTGLYFLSGITFLTCFVHFQNNSIITSEYTVSSERLPLNFNGYKIVQLSDLHSKYFGKKQNKLVEKVGEAEPELIVFTGDLIDANQYNETPSLMLMKQLVHVAPVYYVTGNHEWASGQFETLENQLEEIGVQVMRNKAEDIVIGTDRIQLIGIDDPANAGGSEAQRIKIEENITASMKGNNEENHFQILLSHRPEMFSLYQDYGFDIVFSGHAHGGQIRMPFVGGLIAPNQGFLPDYTSGKHHANHATMVVNRGLGNSVFPLRIFNRPEIVVVTLTSER